MLLLIPVSILGRSMQQISSDDFETLDEKEGIKAGDCDQPLTSFQHYSTLCIDIDLRLRRLTRTH